MVATCLHANEASAYSDPWARLDIKVLPSTSMMNSPSRAVRLMSLPSGVRVWPNSCHGFTGWISLIGYHRDFFVASPKTNAISIQPESQSLTPRPSSDSDGDYYIFITEYITVIYIIKKTPKETQ